MIKVFLYDSYGLLWSAALYAHTGRFFLSYFHDVPQFKILPLPVGQRIPDGDMLFPLPLIQRPSDEWSVNIQPETPLICREPVQLHLRQYLRRRPVIHIIPNHTFPPFRFARISRAMAGKSLLSSRKATVSIFSRPTTVLFFTRSR